MTQNFDTLTYAGVEKSFADWGFSHDSIEGHKFNSQVDTFEATLVGSTIQAEIDTPLFAFEGQVVVRSNRTYGGGSYSGGTIKFVGKRVSNPAAADAMGQRVRYQFQGPLYDLEQSDYMQLFVGSSGSYYLPEVALNTGVTGGTWSIISVGDAIQDILQFVLDQYKAQGLAAPFQYVGRTLNGSLTNPITHTASGTVDLSTNSSTGTPGGNYSFAGHQFNQSLAGGLTIDSTLFSLFLPSFIGKPMKAAQMLQKCLQMSPRVNLWFDYTTLVGSTPVPTIRFDLVDSMTAVTLPLFTGFKTDGTVSHKAVNLTPRYDLQLRAAILKYRITNTVGGVTQIDYAVDKWSGNGVGMALPGASNVNLTGTGNNLTDPNAGLRVFNDLIDLQGLNIGYVKGHMDLEPLVATAAQTGHAYNTLADTTAKRQWWYSRRGAEAAKLEDNRLRFQTQDGAQTYIPDAVFTYASNGYDSTGAAVTAGQQFTSADKSFYTNRIVRGTYQSWMAQSSSVLACKCKVLAPMQFSEYDATGANDTDLTGNVLKKSNSEDQHANIEVTNAVPDTGAGSSGYATFTAVASATPGEAYIIGAGGIAQYLYTHLNTLQFDGDMVTIAANFVDSTSAQYVTLGRKLNLSGGPALALTMAAQIQEITEHYGDHKTSIKFGVSKMLSAGDISSLFNMWRHRRTWYNPALRSNPVSSSNTSDMAMAGAQSNSMNGLGNAAHQAFFDYATAPSGSTAGVLNSAIFTDATRVTAINQL